MRSANTSLPTPVSPVRITLIELEATRATSCSSLVIEPITAEKDVTTQYLTVKRGQVAGVHQTIFGKGKIDVSLELKMYVGAINPVDEVLIKGVPDITATITGGVHGDRATAAMVVNSIPRVVAARPGVLTMDDIPISFR